MKAKILDNKYILKILSFLTLCFLIYSRHKISTDDLTQLSTTFNFINGFGFCLKYFDGEFVTHQSVDSWPMLYRIIAVPFVFITKNIEISAMLIKVLTYLFLYFTLHSFFSCLFIMKKQANMALNICCLFAVTSIAPFNYGGVTDILSVCLVLFCFLFLYKFYFFKKNPKYIVLFYLSIMLLINLRYAYIPIVFFILFCVLFLEIKFKTFKSNLLIKLLFFSFIGLNLFFILTNNYFLNNTEFVLSSVLEKSTIWSYYYSIFFSPFFPDFIILNAINKYIISHSKVLYSFYSTVVLFTVSIGYFIFRNSYKRFINYKFKAFFLEGSLVFCVLINLTSLFVPFGVFGTYSEKNLTNVSYFTNGLLATQDRYQLLASVSIFILLLYYALISDKKIFQYLLISSFIFNLSHFVYLNTRYHLSRYENMKITSLPMGSYNDCLKINSLIRFKEDKAVLFIENYNLNSELEQRQINPGKFAIAEGVTLFRNSKNTNEAVFRSKMNTFSFDKIVYCDLTLNSSKYSKGYSCLYLGDVYSLFKKNARK